LILDNIKRLCRERNLSIHALEKETGIANGVIDNWGSGRPRVDLLKKVADYFGVTVDELLREGTADAVH